ncbi:MAG: FkbM family methyltransferase [Proteobacteria bacterium]|nr:FkbM family methyltransferase [Pseudomonadota bacterium]MBU1737656.1 FkbM family methyltransferase [Pseudomonadota bacterium]
MNLNNRTASITIVDNIQVTVPASLQLMTPYVLHEQGDWFEDEIKFLRTFIKPGMKIIDIGANYGLYTLTLAGIAGDQGKVWAFEPTGATVSCLRKSIADNGFNNIELIQAGLSDKIRKANFFTGPNSELNSLSKESVAGNQQETVLLLTLDHCAKKYQWGDIDFIKLDAEGEESNILKKGRSFLSSSSPLIMFELKHGEKVNLSLINRFESLGYDSYRLIPGLDVLVPFNPDEPFDPYLLNLFCCRKDKAALLEAEQYLVKQSGQQECPPDAGMIREYLLQFPFGNSISGLHFLAGTSEDYLKIFTSYILSRSESASAAERVGYLSTALQGVRDILEKGEHGIEHLAVFARVAFSAGERALGVGILRDLMNRHISGRDLEIAEPFLPVCPRYDAISPHDDINEWLLSSILEQYISKHAFSSYFTRRTSLPLLEKLGELGYMDDQMKKTEDMIKRVFPS